jgi:VIT1/CCC1 family predicted Fe2+/Mn2+ transporter
MHDHVGKAADGREKLTAYHHPDAIAQRLSSQPKQSYLKDMVFGAMDGTVTTFAMVAGVAGAGADVRIALILGLANLFADGFSMASGNFLSARTVRDVLDKARRMEEHHIDMVPDGEREEVRQIFQAKGFTGDVLDEIVRIITRNRKRWVETMLVEEHGLPLETHSPRMTALVTFFAFCAAGAVPLVPLLFYMDSRMTDTVFGLSIAGTGAAFVLVGVLKSYVLKTNMLRSVFETVVLGGLAASIAFAVGYVFR